VQLGMSALCQKRTYAPQQISPLLNHLVGGRNQRRWHGEAEHLRRFEVDHQLVLGRRLHRQVGRLLALEDAIDVTCRVTILIDEIGPIGD
jgi:hypothetical protein